MCDCCVFVCGGSDCVLLFVCFGFGFYFDVCQGCGVGRAGVVYVVVVVVVVVVLGSRWVYFLWFMPTPRSKNDLRARTIRTACLLHGPRKRHECGLRKCGVNVRLM